MTTQERKALLDKSIAVPLPKQRDHHRDSSSDEWSSSYSSHTPYSDSGSEDSYIAEWESYVAANGSLFYLEYHMQVQPTNRPPDTDNAFITLRNNFARSSTRRSKKNRNKLSKLFGRHARKPKTRAPLDRQTFEATKVKFCETANGELKEISVFVDVTRRNKFGRRTPLCESLLGLSTCLFPDGQRVMIAGFMASVDLNINKTIKVGDWLKSIGGHTVTPENLDKILLAINESQEVVLNVQKISDEEEINVPVSTFNKLTNFQVFVEAAPTMFGIQDTANGNRCADNSSLAVMYVTMSSVNETGLDVLYAYPPKEQNCLYPLRGLFFTAMSVLGTTFVGTPMSMLITIKGVLFNVIYYPFGEDLLVFGLSSKNVTLKEAQLIVDSIYRCLEFTHQSLPPCFVHSTTAAHTALLDDYFKMILIRMHDKVANAMAFETILPQAHFVPLPKEAQLRIDDILSEMEAMDYREWNEDPLNSQREFFIIGSAFFFQTYLVASHLPVADLIDLKAFLMTNGLFDILQTQTLRELILWREIYPQSCERGFGEGTQIYKTPLARWILVVIARNQMLLAVFLESRRHNTGHLPGQPNMTNVIAPSAFYVEEIQDTIDHLKNEGIENLVATWITANKRPQCIVPQSTDTTTAGGGGGNQTCYSTSLPTSKKTELISILKRRNNSLENVGEFARTATVAMSQASSSAASQTVSEESNPKFPSNDDSDSDWDGFPDSQKGSSGFDVSEMTETLLREVTDIIPSKVTAGFENVLIHFVQIELGEGIILSPCTSGPCDNDIISLFRKTCHLIHNVLQNTIRFRQILASESSKPNAHRSLVAIKEHGVMVSHRTVSGGVTDIWVIGRLFSVPPKEIYVCHLASVPQNLVEMAFRLSLNSAG